MSGSGKDFGTTLALPQGNNDAASFDAFRVFEGQIKMLPGIERCNLVVKRGCSIVYIYLLSGTLL